MPKTDHRTPRLPDPAEVLGRPGVREACCRAVEDDGLLGVIKVSADGVILEVNDRFCESLGYMRSELVSRKVWQEITHPETVELEQFERCALAAGEKESFGPFRKRYLHKTEGPVPVSIKLTRITDADGNFALILGQVLDVVALAGRRKDDPPVSSGLHAVVDRRPRVTEAVWVILDEAPALKRWLWGLAGTGLVAYLAQLGITYRNNTLGAKAVEATEKIAQPPAPAPAPGPGK